MELEPNTDVDPPSALGKLHLELPSRSDQQSTLPHEEYTPLSRSMNIISLDNIGIPHSRDNMQPIDRRITPQDRNAKGACRS